MIIILKQKKIKLKSRINLNHNIYILAELHHGINPECKAISRNEMIRANETEFMRKNMQEHLTRSTATFKRYACKSVLLKLVSDYD